MDEAGNTGARLDDPQAPVHLIAVLLVPEESVSDVHERVEAVARRHVPDLANRADFEFHAAEIFGGKKLWRGTKPAVRAAVAEDLLRIVCDLELFVAIRGVHKPRLKARYGSNAFHPHDIALMFAIEATERHARVVEHRTGVACRVLMVADESKERERTMIRDLAMYQRTGTPWGWRATPVDRIIDTVHFGRSHDNRALQLADVIASARPARVPDAVW